MVAAEIPCNGHFLKETVPGGGYPPAWVGGASLRDLMEFNGIP